MSDTQRLAENFNRDERIAELEQQIATLMKRSPQNDSDYFGNDDTAKIYMDRCADVYRLEDENAALKAEVARLRGTLECIASVKTQGEDREFYRLNFGPHGVIVKMVTHARAALSPEKKEVER